MRAFIAVLVVVSAVTACSRPTDAAGPYGAQSARFGEAIAVLGWNISVSDLRWDGNRVLVDVDAAPSDPDAPHAEPGELRFGLYGALGRPMEAAGIGSCAEIVGPSTALIRPLAAKTPQQLTGTVCLGPLKDRSVVRGVYVYSPGDRMPGTTVAYGAAFPMGIAPRDGADTGMALSSSSATAWRADGTPLSQAALGDPTAFSGNGYLLLGLVAESTAARYRDDSAERGGPLMLTIGPARPYPGLSPACQAAGSSVLVLPEASLNAVHVSAPLCAHGELEEAALYATVSVIGTHAGVWTQR